MSARDSNSVHKDSKANEPAECADNENGDYAHDGEQGSPMSPGMKQMMMEENGGFISCCDRATNVIAVALIFAVLITSVISLVAGAMCLSVMSGKPFAHFKLFFILGGLGPVLSGCLCLVAAIAALIFISCCAMGLNKYGMCCYGGTCCIRCFRVNLFGILPGITFIVLLAFSILGFTFWSLGDQIAPLDKDYIEIVGLSGPVEIIRDENGLTHITASSRRDAHFGQGFAQAQDRLFQLEFHRMTALGLLGSLVGTDGAKTDQSIRTINIRDAAYAMCTLASDEDRDQLEAFAEGINTFMERVSKRPAEFFFMSKRLLYFHDPEPFSAVDLCLTARLFQWQLSSNVAREGARFAVWAGTNRTYAEVEELYMDHSKQTNTILSQAQMIETLVSNGMIPAEDPANPTEEEIDTALTAGAILQGTAKGYEAAIYDNLLSVVRTQLQASATSKMSIADPQELVQAGMNRVMAEAYYDMGTKAYTFPYQFLYASNAWATRTAEGHTMVASDPHLTINLPSIWYYSHLSYPDENGVQFDAAGVGMVGISGVHIGKTTYLAWGITMSMTDLQDLFILPPAAFSGLPAGSYRYAGINRKFIPRRERIEVKGSKDIVLNVDDTVFGPVVTTMLGFPAALTVALYAVPLLKDDDSSIRSLLSWSDPKTDTAEKFMNSLLDLQAPGFSIPIGDIHGNIAYAVTGRHPLRSVNSSGVAHLRFAHTGRYPTPAFAAMDVINAIGVSGRPVAEMLTQVPDFLSTSVWSSYPSGDTSVPDRRVPKEGNPHYYSAFDNAAFHLSAANQQIVPRGFPYIIGSDFAWEWRGHRCHDMLNANVDRFADSQFHTSMQLDTQSNYWVYSVRDIVSGTDFATAISGDAKAVEWRTRMLAWDGLTPIGSIETSFLWRWIAKMGVLPRDARASSGDRLWDQDHLYSMRMISAPTQRMTAECQDYRQDWTSPTPCLDFAAATFKELATEKDMKWGQDLNHLRGIHEMVDTKAIYPLFRREMEKAGDCTSLGVSNHVLEDDMLSIHAASVRQVFDLWNDTDHTTFALPGGNSGSPYSEYFQNLWDLYEKDEYVKVANTANALSTMKVAHKNVLSR